MFNKVTLIGRLTKDAELGFIPGAGTPKLQYTLAVERKYQKDKSNKKVDFINCEMLGERCEKLSQYMTKGKLILVEGELNIDNYEKDGEKRSYTKVKVDRLVFMPTSKSENTENNQTFTPSFEPPRGLDPNGFQAIDDDEIPF